jgi:hypothetical protein
MRGDFRRWQSDKERFSGRIVLGRKLLEDFFVSGRLREAIFSSENRG